MMDCAGGVKADDGVVVVEQEEEILGDGVGRLNTDVEAMKRRAADIGVAGRQ